MVDICVQLGMLRLSGTIRLFIISQAVIFFTFVSMMITFTPFIIHLKRFFAPPLKMWMYLSICSMPGPFFAPLLTAMQLICVHLFQSLRLEKMDCIGQILSCHPFPFQVPIFIVLFRSHERLLCRLRVFLFVITAMRCLISTGLLVKHYFDLEDRYSLVMVSSLRLISLGF